MKLNNFLLLTSLCFVFSISPSLAMDPPLEEQPDKPTIFAQAAFQEQLEKIASVIRQRKEENLPNFLLVGITNSEAPRIQSKFSLVFDSSKDDFRKFEEFQHAIGITHDSLKNLKEESFKCFFGEDHTHIKCKIILNSKDKKNLSFFYHEAAEEWRVSSEVVPPRLILQVQYEHLLQPGSCIFLSNGEKVHKETDQHILGGEPFIQMDFNNKHQLKSLAEVVCGNIDSILMHDCVFKFTEWGPPEIKSFASMLKPDGTFVLLPEFNKTLRKVSEDKRTFYVAQSAKGASFFDRIYNYICDLNRENLESNVLPVEVVSFYFDETGEGYMPSKQEMGVGSDPVQTFIRRACRDYENNILLPHFTKVIEPYFESVEWHKDIIPPMPSQYNISTVPYAIVAKNPKKVSCLT